MSLPTGTDWVPGARMSTCDKLQIIQLTITPHTLTLRLHHFSVHPDNLLVIQIGR